MRRPRITLVDADQGAGARLREQLAGHGFDAVAVASVGEALEQPKAAAPDGALVVLGPGGEGSQLPAALRLRGCEAAVVVAVAADATAAAVEALRHGAESFVFTPVDASHAALALEKALETRGLRRESLELRHQLRRRQALVGGTPDLLVAQEVIRRAAPTKATVLVRGETGTGRELVAQVLHEISPRRDRPFVRVACAGLSAALVEGELFGHETGELREVIFPCQGRIAQADGGTLFLQEVAGLAAAVQVRLLRLLQHGEYERVGGSQTRHADVRVVASTTHDLAEEVRRGTFRDDLYYRLSVVSIDLPPLRQRKGDIPALVEHFLEQAARAAGKQVRGISPGALSALYAYEWPGNVREMKAAIEQAVARCDGPELGSHHLSPVLQGAGEDRAASALIPGATLSEIEREAILRTLEESGGSTARAARILGISVRKIQYKLKEYRGGNLGRRRRADLLHPPRARRNPA